MVAREGCKSLRLPSFLPPRIFPAVDFGQFWFFVVLVLTGDNLKMTSPLPFPPDIVPAFVRITDMYLGDEACNINTIDHHHVRTFTLAIVHLSTYCPAAAGPCGPLPHSKPPAQPKQKKTI